MRNHCGYTNCANLTCAGYTRVAIVSLMSKQYSIQANGIDMGTYEGKTAEEALQAYVRDAGYDSIESAAQATSQSVEDFRAELAVSEA